jgi:DNA-binding HxlR family transcriptional regulator
LIVCHLRQGKKRFNELLRLIPGLSQKVLTHQLRELESHGLVERIVYPEIPPRVEYGLTDYGMSLIPLLDLMEQWGLQHQEKFEGEDANCQ